MFSGFYSFILFIELLRTPYNIDELLLLSFINTYRSIDQIDDNYKINGTYYTDYGHWIILISRVDC